MPLAHNTDQTHTPRKRTHETHCAGIGALLNGAHTGPTDRAILSVTQFLTVPLSPFRDHVDSLAKHSVIEHGQERPVCGPFVFN